MTVRPDSFVWKWFLDFDQTSKPDASPSRKPARIWTTKR